MFIHKLHLTNFKNHKSKDFFFTKNIVAFIGLNGVGKTNILDAIYFLCVGKSYFSSTDKICIHDEEHFFRIEQDIETTKSNKVQVIVEKGKRKRIIKNQIEIEKIVDYIGTFPVIVVSPADYILIEGGSRERRKFIDYTLSSVNKSYLKHLIQYNHTLKQRNALLKQSYEQGVNKELIEIYNSKLILHGEYIYEQRKQFINDIKPYFTESFKSLSAKDELYSFTYKSDLTEQKYSDILKQSLQKDTILQRTTKGIHKDDMVFKMKENQLKDYASQGQQKTFILALKLTQYNYLKETLQQVPIFIIDDIFDKLDNKRSENLLTYLRKQDGQIFISNTDMNNMSHEENENLIQRIGVL